MEGTVACGEEGEGGGHSLVKGRREGGSHWFISHKLLGTQMMPYDQWRMYRGAAVVGWTHDYL